MTHAPKLAPWLGAEVIPLDIGWRLLYFSRRQARRCGSEWHRTIGGKRVRASIVMMCPADREMVREYPDLRFVGIASLPPLCPAMARWVAEGYRNARAAGPWEGPTS